MEAGAFGFGHGFGCGFYFLFYVGGGGFDFLLHGLDGEEAAGVLGLGVQGWGGGAV